MEMTEHNQRLTERALKALHPLDLGVILICAARGLSGNLQAILATASEFNAREEIVCAAFGYIESLTRIGTPVDVLNDRRAIGFIDQRDGAMQAAWALCRLAAGRHGFGRVCLKRDPMKDAAQYATRLLKCMRANRAARGPMSEAIRLTKRASEISERITALAGKRTMTNEQPT